MKLIMVLAFSALCHGLLPESGDQYKPQIKFSTGSLFDSNITAVVASLRETPSELHLCSASFIRSDALLATARCIYGKIPSQAYIHCMSIHQTEGGITVPVKHFFPHPHFELTPQVNDIGIIILKSPISGAFVHHLPLPWQEHKGSVTVYQWKFSGPNMVFSLSEINVQLITNAKCSYIMRQYVECKNLCIGSTKVHHGSMDEGVPISAKLGNTTYVLAIFNRQGTRMTTGAEKYEKIYPHVEWIKYVLKHNHTVNDFDNSSAVSQE